MSACFALRSYVPLLLLRTKSCAYPFVPLTICHWNIPALSGFISAVMPSVK